MALDNLRDGSDSDDYIRMYWLAPSSGARVVYSLSWVE